jgi:hypothetical protein
MTKNEDEKVTATATMRTPDGREFAHVTSVERRYAGNQEFLWTEGNWACDCNRSLFIGRDHGVWLGAAPQEDDDDGEASLSCGDTITLVRLVVDGVTVYEEQAGSRDREAPGANAVPTVNDGENMKQPRDHDPRIR